MTERVMHDPPDTSSREHVRFLNRYYSKVLPWYDASRKLFLFGRDAMLREIQSRRPRRVIEIGCGTGRNLAVLARSLPETDFGGVEPCDSMREHAAQRYPWITLSSDLVERADVHGLLPGAPDVIFFSYSLSMIQDKEGAIEHCRSALAPGGVLYVLDFNDQVRMGRAGRALFSRWLRLFHVFPDQLAPVWGQADQIAHGPLHYWQRGTFNPRT